MCSCKRLALRQRLQTQKCNTLGWSHVQLLARVIPTPWVNQLPAAKPTNQPTNQLPAVKPTLEGDLLKRLGFERATGKGAAQSVAAQPQHLLARRIREGCMNHQQAVGFRAARAESAGSGLQSSKG